MKERKLDVLGMAETRHRSESAGRDLANRYVLNTVEWMLELENMKLLGLLDPDLPLIYRKYSW